jgi:hypothetical protein
MPKKVEQSFSRTVDYGSGSTANCCGSSNLRQRMAEREGAGKANHFNGRAWLTKAQLQLKSLWNLCGVANPPSYFRFSSAPVQPPSANLFAFPIVWRIAHAFE